MTELEFRGVTRMFDAKAALRDVNLAIQPGEFFSLLGPSGCGKTTLLRIAAGLEHPDRGSVRLGGRDITALPPQERGIGLVFQNYALFPHMTAGENVAFGLRVRKIPPEEIRRRTHDALMRVDLGGKEHTPVTTLSGGEQQRVAVARALVVEPEVLLFDEPLSNLDVTLRQRTREEIRALQRRTGITTLYVTHDQAEALSVSDRIAVMHEGLIEQVGTPQDLYGKPATAFVARFLGWETALDGTLDGDRQCVRLAEPPLTLQGDFSYCAPGPVRAFFPPEMVPVGRVGSGGDLEGRIERVEYRGGNSLMTVRIGGVLVHAVGGHEENPLWHEGESVELSLRGSAARVFPREEL